MKRLSVAFILPGLGRVQRGAETAFLEIASCLQKRNDMHVEVFGSGHDIPDHVMKHHVSCVDRTNFEKWPKFPFFRSEYQYEEFTFLFNLVGGRHFQPHKFDIAMTCAYPYTNWYLQWCKRRTGLKQVFVTQNGDWMCYAKNWEYKLFRCDGLVCINPQHFDAHRDRYTSVLIPNGVDTSVYTPNMAATADRRIAGRPIPQDHKVIFMVSALIPSKRVAEGVMAVAKVPKTFLVVAGDGPERGRISQLAQELLPGRHVLLGSIPRSETPSLYRQMDVFLHMSQDEPFGIVYLEAGSSGLPIVAHDQPVTKWILGDCGIFCNTNNLDEVAFGISKAIDANETEHLGRQTRVRIEQEWTWEIQSEKYLKFFHNVMNS